MGTQLSFIWVLPFVAMLLSIAVMPLVYPKIWHHHFHHIAIGLGLLCALPLCFFYGEEGFYSLAHTMVGEYVPFVILLWSLYTVAGGILVRGSIVGGPVSNSVMMLIGAVAASFVGTTGASMLLIRPILRANERRKYRAHTIVFFIFLVSNIGGALTPLGDPPLFLGFLNGVPFEWTLLHLWKQTLVCGGCVLGIYLLLESFLYSRESKEAVSAEPVDSLQVPIGLAGKQNFLLLAAIIGGVMLSGSWKPTFDYGKFIKHGQLQLLPWPGNEVKHALEFLNPKFPKTQQARLFGTIPVGENDRQPNTLKVQTPSTDSKKNDKHDEKHDHADDHDHGHGAHHGVSIPIQNVARDLILIACGLISLFITPKSIREANGFTWGPINEVALLFLGIFATIIPALQILAAGDKGQLGWFIKMVDTPAHYFWASGILSSCLDNAPTYLSFMTTALGKFYGGAGPENVGRLIAEKPIYLEAVSLGSVFMGAVTYIGNAPNFMVRSIAEDAGVKMPDFFSYVLKYSIPVLMPVFALLTYLFFMGR